MAEALISDEAFIKGCAAIGAGLAVGLAGIGAGAGRFPWLGFAIHSHSRNHCYLRIGYQLHTDVRLRLKV